MKNIKRPPMTTEKFVRRLLIWIFSALFVIVITFLAIRIGIVMSEENSQPSSSKTETSGYLNVLNWTSYIPREVISRFEEEYHIKVNYGTYSSNEELLAKLSSSTLGTYDVVFPSDYMVSLLKSRDMLETLNLNKLPNRTNLSGKFLNQPYDENNTYSLPFLLATTQILYNKNQINNITSYTDLLNPELNNNLVLLDDERIIIGATLLATGHEMNDADEEALDDALAFYDKLRPNIKAYDSDSPKTFFITDEVTAGLIWNAEATLAIDENPDLVAVYPTEGFALSMDNYVILKGSHNQENAYTFINYLLRNDVSQEIVASYPYISPNLSALDLTDEEINEIFTNGTYVKNLDKDATKRYDRLWAVFK